jgi:hypothetical protein
LWWVAGKLGTRREAPGNGDHDGANGPVHGMPPLQTFLVPTNWALDNIAPSSMGAGAIRPRLYITGAGIAALIV